MAAPQLPTFAPASLASISRQEWNDYKNEVDAFHTHMETAIQTLDPNAQIEGAPQAYLDGPTTPTARLHASALVTAWLYRLQAQRLALQVTVQPAPPAAGAAAQPVGAALIQQLIQAFQGAAPPTAPPRVNRVKPKNPDKFEGDVNKSSIFLAQCENYFILSPMNDKQRIRFALGLMRGGAHRWMEQQSLLIAQVPQPAHFATWPLFVQEFNRRFGDPLAARKAAHKLYTHKVVQTITARAYIDELCELCDKARIHNDEQRQNLLLLGLKEDVIKGMANNNFMTFDQLCATAIRTDELLQSVKNRNAPKKGDKKGGNPSKTTGDKVDNSKYKLTEEEKKEHTKGNLCFKCHESGHGSRNCPNPCTIYSETKKKKARVSNVQAKEKTKAKDKGKAKASTSKKAKVKEVAAKSDSETAADADNESEDFSDGN